MQNFLLTIALGAILGYVFCRLGIPGGMMVGSIIAVSIWNIATGLAFMPAESKVLAQIIAGAFIGAGIEKSDLIRLKHIIRPAIALLSGMLVVNIALGFLMYFIKSDGFNHRIDVCSSWGHQRNAHNKCGAWGRCLQSCAYAVYKASLWRWSVSNDDRQSIKTVFFKRNGKLRSL